MAVQMHLGREEEFDERSRLHPFAAETTIKSVAHRTWGLTSNQNGYSGCVGWTERDRRMTSPYHLKGHYYDNAFGLKMYNGATENDQWSDNDRLIDSVAMTPDEGTSLLGMAKYLMSIGDISGYKWSFSLDEWLASTQVYPLFIGISWTQDMFNPDPQGRIRPTGGRAGGHAISITKLELDGPRDTWRAWIWNHWTRKWGRNGKAFMSIDDLDNRRKADADAMTIIPKAA